MSGWTSKQKAQLRLEPIILDSGHWLYEEPSGLSLFCEHADTPNAFQGTISIQTIRAYLKRWEAAHAESPE